MHFGGLRTQRKARRGVGLRLHGMREGGVWYHSPAIVDEQTQQNEHQQCQGCQDGEQEDGMVSADVLDACCDGDQPCARQGLSVPGWMPFPSFSRNPLSQPPRPPLPLDPLPHSHQSWGRPWQPPSTPAGGRRRSSRAAGLPSGSHQCHCVPTALGEAGVASDSVSSRLSLYPQIPAPLLPEALTTLGVKPPGWNAGAHSKGTRL